MASTNGTSNIPPVILYHYPFSPWGRKLTSYLAIRSIPYTSCIQPLMIPRPDLSDHLSVNYRRIPILAIGKDLYCDTALAFNKLRTLFPDGAEQYEPKNAEGKALIRLLEKWSETAFQYACKAIPPDMDAVFGNEAFLKDRTQFFGREWSVESQKKLKSEGDLYFVEWFNWIETTLLADGREWLNGTEGGIGLLDLHVGWILDWIRGMPGIFPDVVDENKGGREKYAKTWAWVNRYHDVVTAAQEKQAAGEIEGAAAARQILSGPYGEGNLPFNDADVTGLQKGDRVQAWPMETGFTHKDEGRLVGLSDEEAIVENSKGVRVHHPRWQFAIQKV